MLQVLKKQISETIGWFPIHLFIVLKLKQNFKVNIITISIVFMYVCVLS